MTQRKFPMDAMGILDQWSLPVMILNRDLKFIYANSAYLKATDKSWDALAGKYVFDAFPDDPERIQSVKKSFQGAFEGELTELHAQPFKIVHPDGRETEHHWRARQEPIYDDKGRVEYILQYAEDITSQTLAENHRDVLINELNHRVKNLLTVIESIARITGRRATTIKAFTSDFTARIQAMGRSHNRLFKNRWLGASITEVIEDTLTVFTDSESRQLTLSGDNVDLSLSFAKDLALVLHELGTNAVKYGALSVPAGRIDLSWGVKDDKFEIVWQEFGMTNLSEPDDEGFGSKLLRLIGNFEADREFLSEGVQVIMRSPLDYALGGGIKKSRL